MSGQHLSYVLTENLLTGRISIGVYDHVKQQLEVNGEPARLADYWAVAELAQVPREQGQEARP
jgi:hypothetical protein